MKNSCLFSLILAFWFGFHLPMQAQTAGTGPLPADTDFAPDELTVKLQSKYKTQGINAPEIERLFRSLNLKSAEPRFKLTPAEIRTLNSRGNNNLPDLTLVYRLKLNEAGKLWEVYDALKASKYFQYVTPETYETPFYIPNDTVNKGSWWIEKVRADSAWSVTKGDTNVVIGFVDSGFDLDHPDMVNQVKYNYADPVNGIDDDGDGYTDNFAGWDFVGPTRTNPVPDNDANVQPGGNPHGAQMTGCACTQTDNLLGVASPGFRTKFLPVKTAGDDSPSLTAAYDGLLYAAQKGAKIINCSFGSKIYNPIREELIKFVTFNYSCLVVAAAGNSSLEEVFYPAGYPYVLSVSAGDEDDRKSAASTFGYHIDLSAPARFFTCATYDNGYIFYREGFTSVACAMTSGALGLLAARFPGYTGLQLGELLRVTSDPTDALNPGFEEKIGKGRFNMYRPMVENPPAVRMTAHQITDAGNNIPEAGETVDLKLNLINYLAPVAGLRVEVSAVNSPFVTVLNPTQTVPAINTLQTVNLTTPFQLQIAGNAPQDAEVVIRVGYSAAGYNDYEYFSILINSTFRTLQINRTGATFNSVGNIGYNDFSTNKQGIGFRLEDNLSWLFEGGLVLAAGNRLSNNVRRSMGSIQDKDFVPSAPINYLSPGTVADAEISAAFADTNASGVKVKVNHRAYAFKNAPDDGYIITEYEIENLSGQNYADFYAGLFTDWDAVSDVQNTASYDRALNMGYVFKDDNYAGTVLLNEGVPVYVNHYNAVPPIRFTPQFKRKNISSDTSSADVTDADVFQFTGAGPFNLPAGGKIKVAFALTAGKSLEEIRTRAQAAKSRYATFNRDTCALSSTVTVSQISCAGAATGVINVRVTGGKEPYTYSLNGAAPVAGNRFENLRAGNYEVVATDVAGCSTSVAVVLTEPAPLRFRLLTRRNTSCPACIDGAVVAQGTGGVPPYSYRINNRRFTGNVLRQVGKGRFTVEIQDANGCTVTRPVEIR